MVPLLGVNGGSGQGGAHANGSEADRHPRAGARLGGMRKPPALECTGGIDTAYHASPSSPYCSRLRVSPKPSRYHTTATSSRIKIVLIVPSLHRLRFPYHY